MHLLDIAPTLLELGGYDVPPSMRDRSGVTNLAASVPVGGDYSDHGEALIRERLSGLGYI